MIKFSKIRFYVDYHFPNSTIFGLGYILDIDGKLYGTFKSLPPTKLALVKSKEDLEKIRNLKLTIENLIGYGSNLEDIKAAFRGPIHITHPVEMIDLNLHKNNIREESEDEVEFIADMDL